MSEKPDIDFHLDAVQDARDDLRRYRRGLALAPLALALGLALVIIGSLMINRDLATAMVWVGGLGSLASTIFGAVWISNQYSGYGNEHVEKRVRSAEREYAKFLLDKNG